jgi:hypothetical protein
MARQVEPPEFMQRSTRDLERRIVALELCSKGRVLS